jgi:RNA polymerase sporulation-specific sigma factor
MVLADIIASNDALALSKLTKEEDISNLYYALDKLTKREREIVVLRFGLFDHEELTQKEVADLLGISQSYISRLEKRILDKMRKIIEERIRVA